MGGETTTFASVLPSFHPHPPCSSKLVDGETCQQPPPSPLLSSPFSLHDASGPPYASVVVKPVFPLRSTSVLPLCFLLFVLLPFSTPFGSTLPLLNSRKRLSRYTPFLHHSYPSSRLPKSTATAAATSVPSTSHELLLLPSHSSTATAPPT